jgi:hypothetical protein
MQNLKLSCQKYFHLFGTTAADISLATAFDVLAVGNRWRADKQIIFENLKNRFSFLFFSKIVTKRQLVSSSHNLCAI